MTNVEALNNELDRLHHLYKSGMEGLDLPAIWARIVELQNYLLRELDK